MRNINDKDKNGQDLFEGDKVLKWWGCFTWKGKTTNKYQIHTIVYDNASKRFILGNSHNTWKGSDVQKLSAEKLNEINIPENTHFFKDGDKFVEFTDQHFMGLNDEEWQDELKRRREQICKFLRYE